MNIYSIQGVNPDGVTISIMIQANDLEEIFEEAREWCGKGTIELQIIRETYHKVKR